MKVKLAVAIVVALALGAAGFVVLSPSGIARGRAFNVPAAAAAGLCRKELQAEARGRLDRMNTGARYVFGTIAGIDAADPAWARPVWTVDATLHFMITSMAGVTPVDAYVVCTVRWASDHALTLVTNSA